MGPASVSAALLEMVTKSWRVEMLVCWTACQVQPSRAGEGATTLAKPAYPDAIRPTGRTTASRKTASVLTRVYHADRESESSGPPTGSAAGAGALAEVSVQRREATETPESRPIRKIPAVAAPPHVLTPLVRVCGAWDLAPPDGLEPGTRGLTSLLENRDSPSERLAFICAPATTLFPQNLLAIPPPAR